MPKDAKTSRRRLGGWGFEGEAFAPTAPMLAWLEKRLGPANPFPSFDPTTLDVPSAAQLPDLGSVSLSTDDLDRLTHARGQSLIDLLRLRSGTVPAAPDAIARPTDDQELEDLLHAADRHQLRIVPWGGGTSVTGGVTVVPDDRPVVTVDLELLAGLQALDEVSGLATLGAGTRGPALEAALGARGFTLGHFPQSFELSTLGGWIVTQSSGQESLGHGRIEAMVAGLDLVAPAGRLHIPALPASAAGPDLRQWITGSEGRFGIVTRATVRVRRRVETLRVEAALARTWQQGIEVARALTRAHTSGRAPLCLLRLSDGPETEVALTVGLAKSRFEGLLRKYLAMRGVDRGCLLLVGAKGSPWDVDSSLEQAKLLAKQHGLVWLGAGPGRNWSHDRFRHPYLRDGLLDRGYATDTFETAAPWSKVETVYRAVKNALADLPVLCHLSHPYGDGVSLYFTFFFRCPSDPDEAAALWAGHKRKAQSAIAEAGAATSHHHGVGFWHAPWAPTDWGELGTDMLRSVAQRLDPNGIMNPHVLLDPTDRLEL